MPGNSGHKRGEEADALAALSRSLREAGAATQNKGTNAGRDQQGSAARHVASEAGAATAAAAAVPAAAERDRKAKKEKKEKKEKKQKKERKDREHKRKRKHAEEGEEEEPATAAAGGTAAEAGVVGSQELQQLLSRLEQAASGLRSLEQQQDPSSTANPAAVYQQLAALADCVGQLCDAVAAAGWAELPAALLVLRAQVHALLPAAGTISMTLPLAGVQLDGLGLQADAARAAVECRLGERGTEGRGVAGTERAPHQQQQRFQQWFMSTFADCYASEVEALQESEPPIPAAVLLQCVRMAADSTAMFPPHHRQLVLAAAAAGAGNGS